MSGLAAVEVGTDRVVPLAVRDAVVGELLRPPVRERRHLRPSVAVGSCLRLAAAALVVTGRRLALLARAPRWIGSEAAA